jgi:alpha-L-fucosidase 2
VALSSLLRAEAAPAADDTLGLLLTMPADVAPSHDDYAEPVVYSDAPGAALRGAIALAIEHDGTAVPIDGTAVRAGTEAAPNGTTPTLRLEGARRVVLRIATATTFAGIALPPAGDAEDAYAVAVERVRRAGPISVDELHERHVAEHAALYGRAELEVGVPVDAPLDERILTGNAHPGGPMAADPALAALAFNFGRYLLISSSRPGGVPANLQGIWNDSLQPPWSSNYTTNINVEMNYWLAESTDLAECAEPLYDLIDGLARTGRRTARELYDAPGWVAHHNTDIWGYTLPVGYGTHDPKWAFWPMAGPWLVRHLWERVLHGGDDEFARARVWEPVRSAAEFALAWLVEQPDGTLGTNPSTSPENQFTTPDGGIGSVARSSTYDLVVLGDLFDILVGLADRLGLSEDPVVEQARAARGRIPGPRIGRAGLVQEWADDFEYPDPTHRHVAHLYFLHPSDWEPDQTLHTATSRSLDERGDESTGWALAWKLLMRTRLRQPEKASALLRLFFRDMTVDRGPWIGGVYPNLFCAHPPFQIDGNFGLVAGLAECLVQSQWGTVDLLPSVPAELGTGRVRGLIARPGIRVDLEWSDESGEPRLVEARLEATGPSGRGEHVVRCGGAARTVTLGVDAVVLTPDLFLPELADGTRPA